MNISFAANENIKHEFNIRKSKVWMRLITKIIHQMTSNLIFWAKIASEIDV